MVNNYSAQLLCCLVIVVIYFTISYSYYVAGCSTNTSKDCYNYFIKDVVIIKNLCTNYMFYDDDCSAIAYYVHNNNNITCNIIDSKLYYNDFNNQIECCKYINFYYPVGLKLKMYVDKETFNCLPDTYLNNYRDTGTELFYIGIGILTMLSVFLIGKIIYNYTIRNTQQHQYHNISSTTSTELVYINETPIIQVNCPNKTQHIPIASQI